ncbi:hypothetical protein Lokhon_01717 [Limimaricola hongkongensis DSM 17492]|uniref:Uncharacterized protein n=1 Tax=Limimaricola hongkongensis DSM 17492 TaxID=1122180 RepID=A0A017HBH0_9RHOB|nr:hypothetical protein Lokhon_01717 [Limimaricola hongkongensis DSM 17492]
MARERCGVFKMHLWHPSCTIFNHACGFSGPGHGTARAGD